MSAGVLNADQVHELILTGNSPAIQTAGDVGVKPEASSIDLPLGRQLWELDASIRPNESQTVMDVLNKVSAKRRSLDGDVVLRKNCIYIVECAWSAIRLPKTICARATAKSSIGRLDILVRLVTDNQPEFDCKWRNV